VAGFEVITEGPRTIGVDDVTIASELILLHQLGGSKS